jgi:hypothetical protein
VKINSLTRAAVVSALAATCIGAAGPADAADRIHVENPAFGQPGVYEDGSHYRGFGIGGDLPGWSVTRGNVEVYGRGFAKAPNGTQALTLNGGTNGTVSQVLETTPGVEVTVTWLQSPDTWTGCSSSTSQVYSAGVPTGPNTDDTELFNPGRPNADGNWTPASITFTPSRYLTTLIFASENSGGACGPLITEVVAHESI